MLTRADLEEEAYIYPTSPVSSRKERRLLTRPPGIYQTSPLSSRKERRLFTRPPSIYPSSLVLTERATADKQEIWMHTGFPSWVNAGGAAQPTQVGGISSVPSPQSASMPLPSAPTPSAQGVYAEGYPRGPTPPNTSVSNDWLGGVSARPVTGQVLSNETAPAMVPVPTEVQEPMLATNDAKLQPGSGNSFMFGGDAFSAAPRTTPQQPPSPAYPGRSPVLSSIGTPKSGAPEPSAKADPFAALRSTCTSPSTGSLPHQTQPAPRPNQQTSQVRPSFSSSGMGVGVNSSSEQWPKMTRPGIQKYAKVFGEVDSDRDGKISREEDFLFDAFVSKMPHENESSSPGRGRGRSGRNPIVSGSLGNGMNSPVGLTNVLDMTCYFNVVFQMLLSLLVVVEEYLSEKIEKFDDSRDNDGAVQDVLIKILSHEKNKGACCAHEALVCRFLDDNEYPDCTRYEGGYTQDALKALFKRIPNSSWVDQTFELTERKMCLGCRSVSKGQPEYYTTLSPTLHGQVITDLLSSIPLKECKHCKEVTHSERKYEDLPRVIIMRSDDNYTEIEILEQIDMHPYSILNNQSVAPAMYDLKAVIVYELNNDDDSEDGHFVAYVKREDKWYEADDGWVSKTTWNAVTKWERGAPVLWAHDARG